MSYDLTDHKGVESKGPSCFMKVRRLSGNLKPHTPVRKLPRLKMPAFIEGSLHSNMFFNLELKPAGNPWFKGTNGKQHHRWAMRLWARLVSEKPTQATCSECPLGSWCKASRQSTNGRRLAHGGVHAVTYSTVKTATQLMVVVAFPPSKSKGSAWTPEFRGVPTDHYWRWTYQDLYYRPDTYGLCVQAFGYEDHMVDNNGKEGHNLQNGQRHTLAWLVQRACSTTVPSQYRPTLTRVYPFCWPIQIRLTTLAPQVCNPVAEAPFAATTKTHCEAVTCGKVSKTTYMPHGTTWGCKQFLTGPQVQVTPTCPLNLLDHYQVEHMFDDAQTSPLTGHGFGTNIVNSYANFVMAWGQWNNLGTFLCICPAVWALLMKCNSERNQ